MRNRTAILKKNIVIGYVVFCALGCNNGNLEKALPKENIAILDHVDPFIGTGFHGHTFPGPVMPHGMVQLSPDTKLNGWDASSGYHFNDSTIYGFSHTHLSGTGIGDMGDILILPFTGNHPREKPIALFNKVNEQAQVGSYSVKFNNYDVRTELAVTQRVGVHKYTYGSNSKKRLLLDIGHILQRSWGHDNVVNELKIIDNHTLKGLKHSKGWANDHKVYFYIEFSSPFNLDEIQVDNAKSDPDSKNHTGKNIFAYLSFDALKDDQSLLIKVGISPVDRQGAKKNMEEELPHWDFETVKENAKKAWGKELQRIKVTTEDKTVLTNFYTAMYHSMIAPMIYQDVDGRYRGMDKQIHRAETGQTNYTVYSLWDTFRALHPLMTIIDEPKSIAWANNLLLKYEQGGMLPKWPLSANYTGTMIGYPAVANLADILSKNIMGVDKEKALRASLVSASYSPELLNAMDEPRKDRLMPLYNKYINENRHIPSDKIRNSVSYGLENSYYDWCIGQIAEFNNNDSITSIFKRRSKDYTRYFDTETGFMRGKNEDGSWKSPFNPRLSDHENSDYIEGNAWQWTWFVPHDIEGFIKLSGGKRAFGSKLDSLFTTSSIIEGENASGDITGLIGQYAHGNEPSHHITYFYTYVDEPWKTQELIDQIQKEFYTPTPDGIIGNEDCGQMSAWYILNAIGFYQVTPGKPIYTIGRPLFKKVEIPISENNVFTVITKNNGPENKYVQAVSLNGKAHPNLFFTHDDIKKGSTLTITMGNTPKK
ncbi:GH92 family glycosyl hydrolase [Maribacter sp. 2304DJ31-5]|uniref:GH92 family glycosyl hydrolase n=1 Tax=Maribacter sp. 2304DJ31-5 TaxID=3386273 RepID=UPI0039BC2FBF